MKVSLSSYPGSTQLSINCEIMDKEAWIMLVQVPYVSEQPHATCSGFPKNTEVFFDQSAKKEIREAKEVYLSNKYGKISAWHRSEADLGIAVENWDVEIPDEELLTHERRFVREYALKRLGLC